MTIFVPSLSKRERAPSDSVREGGGNDHDHGLSRDALVVEEMVFR